jgi:Domain of unknown function (DUF222)
MAAELMSGEPSDGDWLFAGAPVSGYHLGLESSCPPEYANVSTSELFAAIDAQRQARAADTDEVVGAGFRPRTPVVLSPSGSGFESGAILDVCPPGGSLAGLTDAATRDGGLAKLDDDELIGVLRAWRRLEAWCSSGGLAAIAELARRRPAERTPAAPPGEFPVQLSEFIGDEVAAALTLTARTADVYLNLALDLAIRLPGTAQALHEGVIDYPRARLIADLTRVLSDDDARAVEARVLPAAGQQTTGQLRATVARAVLAVDPEAATRRREQAQRDPRVRRWQEDAGTAALAGFGLPPAEVLEADQRLTDRALALRDAGLPGSLEELRARAYLDTLLGQDSSPSEESGPRPGEPSGAGHPDGRAGPATPLCPTVPLPPARSQRRLAARVNLTVPLVTQLGLAGEPGDVAGFGPVDPALARELTTRAAADPASRFCVTVTGPAGQAIGHGCIPGRPPDLGGSCGFTVTLSLLAGDRCDHRHQEPAYQPSRKLRHLIEARHTTCCAPGCGRRAARCDLDHTVPYDQGGRTCECNLAPLCRHHHRCKQSEGWQLEQAAPGQLRWTTPSGRIHLTSTTP